MRHCTWTYVGDAGYSAKVGLLHSTKSGHLIVYVNAKITVIDFKIRNSKTYSFFINDELCELKLERKNDQMFYHFEINKDADTPRNRARRTIEKKHLKQTFSFFAFFGICVIGLFLFLGTLKKVPSEGNQIILPPNSLETIAKVNVNLSQNDPRVSYFFIAENSSYSSPPQMILSTGMPLEQGDEFIVQYAPGNPQVNKIRFDKPTQKQLGIYQERIFERHKILNPTLENSIIKCQIGIAFQVKGLAGLADFYFQNVPAEQNNQHNQNTYLRLTRDVPFQKLVKENCWD